MSEVRLRIGIGTDIIGDRINILIPALFSLHESRPEARDHRATSTWKHLAAQIHLLNRHGIILSIHHIIKTRTVGYESSYGNMSMSISYQIVNNGKLRDTFQMKYPLDFVLAHV